MPVGTAPMPAASSRARHLVRHERRCDIDVGDRRAEQRVAHRAADKARRRRRPRVRRASDARARGSPAARSCQIGARMPRSSLRPVMASAAFRRNSPASPRGAPDVMASYSVKGGLEACAIAALEPSRVWSLSSGSRDRAGTPAALRKFRHFVGVGQQREAFAEQAHNGKDRITRCPSRRHRESPRR